MKRAAVALALLPFPAIAAPPLRVYVVERLGDGIGADDSIGPKRAGLICLPSGHIRWRDLVPGERADRREIVQDALEDAGLPILSTASASTRRQFRIRGLVTEASANLCARQQLLGDSAALSGTARLTIEWRIEDVADPGTSRRHVSAVDRKIAAGNAASAGTIGRALIGDAARDLAEWLKSTQSRDTD